MPTTLADPPGAREAQPLPGKMMLRSLPAQYREIVVATYFQRRTPREAAQLLGIPPEVAKARLYQAMRDLSAMVAAGWPEQAPHPVSSS